MIQEVWQDGMKNLGEREIFFFPRRAETAQSHDPNSPSIILLPLNS